MPASSTRTSAPPSSLARRAGRRRRASRRRLRRPRWRSRPRRAVGERRSARRGAPAARRGSRRRTERGRWPRRCPTEAPVMTATRPVSEVWVHATADARGRRFLGARERGTNGPLNESPEGLPSCSPTVDAATDIAEFLTTRRAKITPEQAGLPSYGKRRVPGLRREEVASLAGVSAEYYRRLERGQVSGVSELVLEALARALQLDDAERAHLFDLARAASRSRRSARGRPRSASARSCSASSTRSRRRRSSAPSTATTSAANALGRALYAPVFDSPEQPANSARFTFLDPAAPRLLPRLGAAGLRARRVVALAGRAQPVRPQPPGPHRRAVDAQRGVPRPLGGAQRALPPDGHQAPAPPGRRRAGAQLRDADARRRRRPAHGALHRRSRLGLPAGARPAGQLDGNADPTETCAARPASARHLSPTTERGPEDGRSLQRPLP